ncbi:MAG: hypothetical protein DRQ47_01140 [Gammaproteobacteria bacterium]|nr:MAG: hypothetical protein DRQ47_01140 [Gammaproteobacteria bacterium]
MEQVLYELPEGWVWENLTDVTRIGAERGFVPEVNDGKAPFIGMSNIDQDTGLDSEYELRDFESVRKGYTKFQKNAVLLAKITPCTENNKTALIQGINGGYATTEVYPIHSLPKTYPHYLLQFLRSPSIRELLVSKMEGATGRQRVPTDAVSSLKIPLPPLSEQKRIVAKLDALFTRIDSASSHLQQTLELSNALFASALDGEFNPLRNMGDLYELPDGWEWSTLEDQTIPTKNIKPTSAPNQQFTYIDISSIDRNINQIADPKIILGSEAPSRAKKEVFEHDVLFATTRPNLKNVAMFSGGVESPVASTGFCVLRAAESIEPSFLFRFLTTEFLQQQISSLISGAQYPAITDKNLKLTPIPLPSINEQKRIITHLDALSERTRTLETATQEKLNGLIALKASLLDAAFKGQL